MIAVGYHGRVKKALIAAAIAVTVAAILAAVGIAGAAWMGERRLARTVEVRVVPVAYTRDPAAPKLGKHLFESRGCALCHGADGRGIAVVNAPNGAAARTTGVFQKAEVPCDARPTSRAERAAWSPTTTRAIGCARSGTA